MLDGVLLHVLSCSATSPRLQIQITAVCSRERDAATRMVFDGGRQALPAALAGRQLNLHNLEIWHHPLASACLPGLGC
jgi:hypothetical protein